MLSQFSRAKIANLIALLLIAAALPWVFYNFNHPLMKTSNIFNTARIDQYFSESPQLREPYFEAAEFLKSRQCADIGLSFGSGSREYPLWILLQRNADKTIRIEHINVNNISAIKQNTAPFNQFNPCAIVSDRAEQGGEIVTENGFYVRAFSSGSISIFVKR